MEVLAFPEANRTKQVKKFVSLITEPTFQARQEKPQVLWQGF